MNQHIPPHTATQTPIIDGIPAHMSRPYADARRLDLIDSAIRDLVDTMNVPGVMRTSSSCEGHRWRGHDSAPYVTFIAAAPIAGQLSRILEHDRYSVHRRLICEWTVTGRFNDGWLIFDLASPGTARGFPLRRDWVNADFAVLCDMVQRVVRDAAHLPGVTTPPQIGQSVPIPVSSAAGGARDTSHDPVRRARASRDDVLVPLKRPAGPLAVFALAICLSVVPVAAQTPAPTTPASAYGAVAASTSSVQSTDSTGAAAPVKRSSRHRSYSARATSPRPVAQPMHRPGPDGTYTAQASPDDTSLVQYPYDADYTFPIATIRNQQTHIEFAADEKIVGVYMSDPKRWIVTTSITGRDVLISPREAGLSNPMSIITTRRRYELGLKSAATGDFYQRVNWYYPESMATHGQATATGVEFPDALKAGTTGGVSPDSTVAGATTDADTLRARASEIDLAHANFGWRVEGDAPFAPTMVFDDGRSLFLRIPHDAEMPAIFILDENGHANLGSWVSVPNAPDFYRITQMPTYGVQLMRGNQKVQIFNRQGGGCNLFGCHATKITNIDDGRSGS